jgi:hypothetical protein
VTTKRDDSNRGRTVLVGCVSMHEHTVLMIAFADERTLDHTALFPATFAAAAVVVAAAIRALFGAAVTVTVVVGNG